MLEEPRPASGSCVDRRGCGPGSASAQVRPKVERRDRRRRHEGGGRSEHGGTADAPNQTVITEDAPDGQDDGPDDDGGAAAARADAGRRRRQASRRGSGSGRSSDREAGVDRGEEGGHHGRADDRRAVRCGRGFLRGLAGQFGVDDTETATSNGSTRTVEIRLTGGDLGLLIGPKGQTLQLIQELARTTVQRRGGGTQEGRIRIDIAGYRQRRSEALARFTEQVAADVVAAGSPKALEPMNPADRKVVHDTANGIEGVRTVSEGEEPRRRVVILPAE